MAEERQVQVVIQALTEKAGEKGAYHTIETPPRTGRQFPEKYNVWDAKLLEGVKVGDAVALTLRQGKPRKEHPQNQWDYFWDVVAIAKGTGAAPVETSKVATPEKVEPEKLPWHRFVAWGEFVEQAIRMVAATFALGEGEVAPENQLAEYTKRFEWAMETICNAVRKQMKEG